MWKRIAFRKIIVTALELARTTRRPLRPQKHPPARWITYDHKSSFEVAQVCTALSLTSSLLEMASGVSNSREVDRRSLRVAVFRQYLHDCGWHFSVAIVRFQLSRVECQHERHQRPDSHLLPIPAILVRRKVSWGTVIKTLVLIHNTVDPIREERAS
jgi:hypothetical protein